MLFAQLNKTQPSQLHPIAKLLPTLQQWEVARRSVFCDAYGNGRWKNNLQKIDSSHWVTQRVFASGRSITCAAATTCDTATSLHTVDYTATFCWKITNAARCGASVYIHWQWWLCTTHRGGSRHPSTFQQLRRGYHGSFVRCSSVVLQSQ